LKEHYLQAKKKGEHKKSTGGEEGQKCLWERSSGEIGGTTNPIAGGSN